MRIDAIKGRHVLVGDEFAPATVVLRHGAVESIESFDAETEGLSLQVPDSAYVLPGVVDTHVHINEPGRPDWEGFLSATEAAALGGATTLLDMPLNSIPATTTTGALERKQAAAHGKLMVD